MALRIPSQLTYNDLNGQEAKDILVNWFRQLLDSQPVLQPHLTLPMAKITLDIGVAVDMYVGGSVPIASPPERLDIAGSVTLSNDVGQGQAVNATSLREQPAMEHREAKLSTVVNAAPIAGGVPPDQVREQHGLPTPRPGYGSRDTGSHIFIADIPDAPAPPQSSTGGRDGIVADGYVFSSERADPQVQSQVLAQTIAVDNGEIQLDLKGDGITHAGMLVRDRTHKASVKELGDGKGAAYSSVNGVYDAGPRGLMAAQSRGGAGMYGDGRPRISFGNKR